MKKRRTKKLKPIWATLFTMVAEHVALTIWAAVTIVVLAALYYVCQQGVFDDKKDPVVELPFER